MKWSQLDKKFVYEWDHDHDATCHSLDKRDIVEAFRPCIRMNLKQNTIINEATYKEIALLIDGNFLRQKVRADALTGIRYTGFDGDTMKFMVNSSEYVENRIQYLNQIKFDEWEEVGQDDELSNPEKARLLLWAGNIRLSCSCPSYIFWGYQYLQTVIDAAIYPEERKPVIRNPNERGIVCKHQVKVLKVIPWYLGNIATELKRQFG